MKNFGFIELHADVTRNREDSYFARERGSVKYVLDADIVEMFVQPYQYLISESGVTAASDKRCSLFDWGLVLTPRPGPGDEMSVMPELAMITAEYILSDKLPGADGYFYFTPWHQREIESQCRHLITNLSRISSNRIALGIKEMAEKYKHAIATNNKNDWKKSSAILMRHASRDEESEPFEQLCRFLALTKSKGRLISDLYAIEKSKWGAAKDHFDFFIRSLTEKSPGRLTENIQHDALSLTYLTLASSDAHSKNEKIVFITGDKTLFEVYCDWFYSSRNGPKKSFICRRVSQYSPILNMSSADSDIASPRTDGDSRKKTMAIMDSLEEIVFAAQTPIIPLIDILAQPEYDDADRFYWKSWYIRETQVAKSQPRLSASSIGEERIRNGLIDLQNDSSVIFSSVIQERLDTRFKETLDIESSANFFARVREEVDRRLSKAHADAETLLIENSDLPTILFLYALNKRKKHRVPDTFYYMAGGKNAEKISTIINNLEHGANYESVVTGWDFVDLRAFGAAVALTTHSWREANFYAQRALSLAKSEKRHSERDLNELIFLECVTRRFYLADSLWTCYEKNRHSHTNPSHTGSHETIPSLKKQVKATHDSIDEIQIHMQDRARSEKAALYLFAFQSGVKNFIEDGENSNYLETATDFLLEAHRSIEGNVNADVSAARQIYHNVASHIVLTTLLISEEKMFSDGHAISLRMLRKLLLINLEKCNEVAEACLNSDLSRFLMLESTFFLYLFSPSAAKKDQIIKLANTITANDNLGMDCFIADKIKDLVKDHSRFHRVYESIENARNQSLKN